MPWTSAMRGSSCSYGFRWESALPSWQMPELSSCMLCWIERTTGGVENRWQYVVYLQGVAVSIILS